MAEITLHPQAQSEFEGLSPGTRSEALGRRVGSRRRCGGYSSGWARAQNAHGWYDDEFRQAVVSRYPYSIIYKVEDGGDVLVVAVAHASREPEYWRGRA